MLRCLRQLLREIPQRIRKPRFTSLRDNNPKRAVVRAVLSWNVNERQRADQLHSVLSRPEAPPERT